MTDYYKQRLGQVGVNLNNALDRFMGSEALYEKFLQKFPQDETYKHLDESINAGDVDRAFLYAHTLKGLAANLEMGYLLEVLTPLTEQLRNRNMDKIAEQQEELKSRYEEICCIIMDKNDQIH